MIPLKDTILREGFPFITWAIIAVNGIIFLFELSLPKNLLQQLFYVFGLVPARYSYPSWAVIHGLSFDDYLSFLTAMFLHGGWLHIIGNMWFLYIFGSTVEDGLGHLRFLILYFLAGIAASVLYFLIDIRSKIPEFGASGAIAGVMGAYIVMFPRARILTLILIFIFPIFVELSAFFYMGYWFFIQLVAGTLSFGSQQQGGIAWWAHVGGFLAGMMLVFLLRRQQRRKNYSDETYHYLKR
jgi:membrane associated rhomboid family serine protease